ncbi:MAG TPA: TetR/AcrR family transcriptional regulator [Anaerolineales bacterium]|nr:TetR/AcrR family transcriptional regulator [Anaerolineales bacterium]
MQNDRRIRRTKRALAAAITELASSHPYDTITIREITEKADVGYATFFRHYNSKDDLMLEIFDNVTKGLEMPDNQSSPDRLFHEGERAFTQVKQNAAVFRGVLCNYGLTRKLKKVLMEHIRRSMEQQSSLPANQDIPPDITVHQMAVSVIGLFEWWLDEKMHTPVEEMARIYEILIRQASEPPLSDD